MCPGRRYIDGQRELSDGCWCAKYYDFLYVVVVVARGVGVIPKSQANPSLGPVESLWSVESLGHEPFRQPVKLRDPAIFKAVERFECRS